MRRGEAIKDGAEFLGNRTRVKVVKNKVAPPFKEAEFDIMYGKGISQEGIICDMAVENDLIKKAGAWFSYNGERIGQGRENAKKYLAENPEVAFELEQKIREIYGATLSGDGAQSDTTAEDLKRQAREILENDGGVYADDEDGE